MKTLEELGRVRLSPNFFMRDMLYREIANFHGKPMVDAEQAVACSIRLFYYAAQGPNGHPENPYRTGSRRPCLSGGGNAFPGLAVVLGKQRWPELIAKERKKDFGLDAYVPPSVILERVRRGR